MTNRVISCRGGGAGAVGAAQGRAVGWRGGCGSSAGQGSGVARGLWVVGRQGQRRGSAGQRRGAARLAQLEREAADADLIARQQRDRRVGTQRQLVPVSVQASAVRRPEICEQHRALNHINSKVRARD